MSCGAIRFAVACGVGAIGLALAVFCGWALKIEPLKTVLPGLVPMVPWTATALMFSGASVIGATLCNRWPPGRWLQYGGALATGAISSIVLLEYATGIDWGFDRVLFGSAVAELTTHFPGRLAGITAVLFLVLSSAMIVDAAVEKSSRVFSVLANLGLFVSCLPLLGYAFSAETLYTSIPYSSMALPTAMALVILFGGALAARPSHGWIALLLSDSLGGMTARRFLPVVIGAPLTISITLLWISRLTHMEPDFRLAISTVAVTVVLLWMVVRNARRLEQIDRERQAAMSALVSAKEEAEAASLAKSSFLANMSHELRTPLTAILGFSQLLELGGEQSEEHGVCVDHIRKNGKHLLALINDLLDLAKIDAGQISTSPERIVLGGLLVGLKASLLPQAEAAGITVSIHADGAGLPDVRADQTRLNQVLLNLGSNAIKYNRPGGRVDITYERLGPEWLRLTVTDTGLGIPEARQSELFEPFNRLGRETGSIEGTGIGLALSRRLMQLMGGRIGFSSRANEGSRFWIDLPVYQAAPHDDVSLAAAAQCLSGQAHEPTCEGRTVLCVDDNAAARELVLKIIVGIPGTHVQTAETAEMGIELARREQPDLILMDINLPGMNGIAALKELRRHSATRNIPVFALSAAATMADIDKGLAAGFDRYLTKPYDVRDLLTAVREQLLDNARG